MLSNLKREKAIKRLEIALRRAFLKGGNDPALTLYQLFHLIFVLWFSLMVAVLQLPT